MKQTKPIIQSFLARSILSRTLRLETFSKERKRAEELVNFLNKMIATELEALSEDEKELYKLEWESINDS